MVSCRNYVLGHGQVVDNIDECRAGQQVLTEGSLVTKCVPLVLQLAALDPAAKPRVSEKTSRL